MFVIGHWPSAVFLPSFQPSESCLPECCLSLVIGVLSFFCRPFGLLGPTFWNVVRRWLLAFHCRFGLLECCLLLVFGVLPSFRPSGSGLSECYPSLAIGLLPSFPRPSGLLECCSSLAVGVLSSFHHCSSLPKCCPLLAIGVPPSFWRPSGLLGPPLWNVVRCWPLAFDHLSVILLGLPF